MSEFSNPRRPRPSARPSDGGEENVYDLADDDAPEPGEDGQSPAPSPFDDTPALGDDAEPTHPRASGPAPAPLPRLWKTDPEPEDPGPAPKDKDKGSAKRGDDKSARKDRSEPKGRGAIERAGSVRRAGDKEKPASRGRAARGDKEPSDGPKGVLLEETPNLDTYETRKKARILIGVAGLGVCLLIGFALVRYLSPGGPPSIDASPAQDLPAAPVAAVPAQDPARFEQEARNLFDRAKKVAQTGNVDEAVTLLAKVVASYPGTPSAREAKEALARPSKKLPLFLDVPAVVATAAPAPKPAPKAEVPPPTVVDATKAAPPMPTTGEVGVVPPPDPSQVALAANSPGAAPEPEEPPLGRPLPLGFRHKPGTQVDATGWPREIVGDRDGAVMVLVPGCEFTMGRNDGEPSERPAHKVRVSTYYIDQHEVTVGQFDLFQKEANRRGDRDRALAREKTPLDTSEDFPVVMVSAKDAKDYAGWARKRLPTEAQWELAARGPDGRIYPQGSQPPDWGKARESRKIEPVMSFAADVSPYGAYDMAGNAWEWTKDWYDPLFFQVIKGQVASDPVGPSKEPPSHELVVKGGSKTWTLTKREGLRFDKRLRHVGFRCVLPVEGPDNAFETPKKPAPAAPAGAPAIEPGMPGGAPPF